LLVSGELDLLRELSRINHQLAVGLERLGIQGVAALLDRFGSVAGQLRRHEELMTAWRDGAFAGDAGRAAELAPRRRRRLARQSARLGPRLEGLLDGMPRRLPRFVTAADGKISINY